MDNYYQVDARTLITIGIIIGVMLSCVAGVVADWINRMQFGKGRQETNEKLAQMSKAINYLAGQNEKMPHRDTFLKLSNQLKILEKNILEKESVRQTRSLEAAIPKQDSENHVNGIAKH